jgi:hypothetical protein
MSQQWRCKECKSKIKGEWDSPEDQFIWFPIRHYSTNDHIKGCIVYVMIDIATLVLCTNECNFFFLISFK